MEIRPILSALLRSKTGAILVALQVAISLAILANALHIVNLRQAVAARSSGVADESTLLYTELRHLRDVDHNAQLAQQQAEAAALRAIAGVTSVAMVNQLPLTQSGYNTGVAADPRQEKISASTSHYFTPDSMVRTLGLKLIEGRDFRPDEVKEVDSDKDDDASSSPRALIVSRALAQKVWPNQSSYLGKTLYYGTGADAQGGPVVGVVETLQSQSAQVSEEGEFSAIMPMRMTNAGGVIYAIRVEAGQVERLMKEVEAALLRTSTDRMIVRVKKMSDTRADRYRADIALSWMLVTVSTLLLLITASGIVGISSLWVTQRRKQIGVRRALGARRVDILRYFLLENFMITSVGVASGVLLAIGLNQLLVSNLEMAKLPLDYLLTGAVVFWLLGALAVYGPAWRAASISPATATRST
ncbi:ABC transporter permease [Massilia sp. DWR3-1-1]|uniref:ABC transporter permease n=1 Tax=Massilia sp. DWR3-1-1 TaxID=2804559 RepID=UPI003CF50508